jgi:hypothetical protein
VEVTRCRKQRVPDAVVKLCPAFKPRLKTAVFFERKTLFEQQMMFAYLEITAATFILEKSTREDSHSRGRIASLLRHETNRDRTPRSYTNFYHNDL